MSKRTQSVSRRRQPQTLRRTPGFTLVELVMTIAMAAILLSVAVPSFQEAMRTNRIAALTNELSTSLQLARSEAVSRGRRVTVCKSDDILATSPACDSSADWQDGWLVFLDSNGDGDRNTSTGSTETLLRISQPSSDTVVITSNGFPDNVRYLADGSIWPVTNNRSICIAISDKVRAIVIEPTGRLSIKNGTCP
ncbi:GspH/FimT family pseudopilin [Thiocystis violacea]|uniref:GspH/FimT family pseudopilin n=1 Tax=Thiocystis violacea TaxID=13725 RepID=UPI0023EF0A52|nr:GspH/FimT family pseudopilin [Thiocystis violacea]MBK1719529.1 hypothetical protein [Thiocystis violacea]